MKSDPISAVDRGLAAAVFPPSSGAGFNVSTHGFGQGPRIIVISGPSGRVDFALASARQSVGDTGLVMFKDESIAVKVIDRLGAERLLGSEVAPCGDPVTHWSTAPGVWVIAVAGLRHPAPHMAVALAEQLETGTALDVCNAVARLVQEDMYPLAVAAMRID